MSNDAWNTDAKVVNKLCPSCAEKCKQSEFVRVVECKFYRSRKADSNLKRNIPSDAL